ncbi:MAG: hypothetical protein P4L57_08720, partial [Rhizomicrobium sp.]|nr:hypothetical protein [Rhizomicrobium sp.]
TDNGDFRTGLNRQVDGAQHPRAARIDQPDRIELQAILERRMRPFGTPRQVLSRLVQVGDEVPQNRLFEGQQVDLRQYPTEKARSISHGATKLAA